MSGHRSLRAARAAVLCCAMAVGIAAGNPSQALATCAAASTAKYPTAVKATPGLIGYWRLNETSGTQACDAHGTHHGTYSGSLLFNQSGALSDLDPSAAFDGASTGIRVPNALQLSPLAVSIEAWVNTTNITKDEQTIARKQGQYLFQVTGAPGYTNGNLKIRIYKSGGSYDEVQWGAFNGGNVWRHVVATFDGSAMRVYSNGVLVASKSMSGALPSTTSDLMIGRTDDATEPDHMQGRIDDVSIYSRALSATEIKSHYDKSAPDTSITSAPDPSTNSGSATFAFSSPDAATTSFECKLDSEPWATCTTPKSYANLGDGKHTFSTRAKTAAGYVDVTPATSTWRVERLAMLDPDTLHADGAEVIWTPFHGSGFTAYEVHRSLSSTFTPSATTLLARITAQTTTRFRDTSAAPATSFTYKLLVNGTESGTRTVTLPADGEATKTLQPGPETGRGAWFYTGWDCSNAGDGESLKIGRPLDNGFIMRSVLAFDVSDIPADATIHSASLALRAQHTPGETTTFNLHRVTTAWEEGDERDDCEGPGVSWVNAAAGTRWITPGGDYDPVAAASVTKPANAAHGWDTYSVTTLMRQWVKGEVPNLGMLFKLADEAPGTNKVVHYASDDSATDITRRPKMTISYRDGGSPVKPTVAIAAPAPGSDLSGTATVSADAGDDRRVESVQFFVDGTSIGTDTSEPFSVGWNTTTATAGAHTLTAKATDDAGNHTTSSGVSVNVDNSAVPVVSITEPPASYQAAVMANSPAAYWRLGETTGTTAADSSGNNRAGTLSGSYTLNTPSLILGSTDPSVLFKNNATADGKAGATGLTGVGGTTISAEAWVDYAALPTSAPDNYILSRGWGAAGGWNLVAYRSGTGAQGVGFQIDVGGTASGLYVDHAPGRHHLVATYDGTTMRLYVNGTLKGSKSLAAAPLTTTAETQIGRILQTDIAIDEVAVYGSVLSAADVSRHYAAGAGTKGVATVKATASAAAGLSKVEFLVDSAEFGAATTSPYQATLDTKALKVYDGPHELVARAIDTRGKSTLSTPVSIHVANAAGTKYDTALTTTASPPSIVWDPSPTATQDTAGFEVTIRNNHTATLPDASTKLRWRWIAADGTVAQTSSDISIGGDLAAKTERTLKDLAVVKVTPPALPKGVDRADYTLRFDLYDTAAAKWFSDEGPRPVDSKVTISRKLPIALGLEKYYHYDSESLGAGMQHMVNLASGNSIVRWTPWATTGRGLSTVLDITYNSAETHSRSPLGNNFSLSISSLVRFGSRLDIHPNKADQLGKATPSTYVEFVDGDGTAHRFDAVTLNGTVVYKQPAGVHLYLRPLGGTDATRAWALTRPDRVTYFFDSEGFPTFVKDGNGNEIKFTLVDTPPADDPGGPKKRVTEVIDPGGRKYLVDYWTKAETKDPQIRGRIESISDHSNSKLDFRYYADGNLMRIIERGGPAPDGTRTDDRSFLFVYTTNTTSAAAPADIDNPPTAVPNQSTRLHSVRDPRLNRTRFTYLDGDRAERSMMASRINRRGKTTTFAYDALTRVTTVTPPAAGSTATWGRQRKFTFDTDGKVLEIAEPHNRLTKVAWTAHRHVAQVTEPSVATKVITTKYEYDHNGYLTAQTDQMNRRTTLAYDYSPVDANDVLGKWSGTRNHGHIGDLARRTDPLNHQWVYDIDDKGNLLSATDPTNAQVVNTYDGFGNKLTRRDQNLNVTQFQSHDLGGQPQRIVEVADTAGATSRTTDFSYTLDGLLRTVQAPRHAGKTGGDERQYRSVMEYDAFHRLARHSTPQGDAEKKILYTDADYDANDNLKSEYSPHKGNSKGAGSRTDYVYDEADGLLSKTGPIGATGREHVVPTEPVAEPAKTQFVYDDAGRTERVIMPKGNVNTDLYSARYKYDDLDRIKTTIRYETTAKLLQEHRCYDAAGNLDSVTAPGAKAASVDCASTMRPSHTTRYAYFDDHRIQQETEAQGKFVTYEYTGRGELFKSKDEELKETIRTYDARGKLTTLDEPFNGTDRTLTRYVYDPAGNLKWEFSPRAADEGQSPGSTDAINEAKHYTTGYDYDDFNQMVRIQLPKDANDPRHFIHRRYDADGNMTAVSLPVANTSMPLDPNRPSSENVPDPLQVSRQEHYDTGWLRYTWTPGGPRVGFEYTEEGWQSKRVPAHRKLAGDTSPEWVDDTERAMTWRYYADGRVQQKRARDGQISQFWYDRHGNMTGGREDAGAVKQDGVKSEPMDIVAKYDDLDRLVETQSGRVNASTPAGVAPVLTNYTATKYAYDENGNTTLRIDNLKHTAGATPEDTEGRRSEFTYDFSDKAKTFLDYGPNSGTATPASPGDTSDDRSTAYDYYDTGRMKQRKIVKRSGAQIQRVDWEFYDNGLMKNQVTRKADDATVEDHALTYTNGSGVYLNGHPFKDAYRMASARTDTDPKPCKIADATPCETTYAYDARDRLVNESRKRGANTLATGYELYPSGSIKRRLVDGKERERFEYRGVQMTTATATDKDNNAETKNRFVYDTAGNLRCRMQEEGTDQACLNHVNGENDTEGLIDYFGYDKQDRLMRHESRDADGPVRTTDYNYDVLNRTISENEAHGANESGPGTRDTTFKYSGLGGDVTEEFNRPKGGTADTRRRTYSYDASGMRIGMNDARLNADGSAATTNDYTYGQDTHGSASLLLKDGGGVQASYSYNAYGETDERKPDSKASEPADSDRLSAENDPGGSVSEKDPLNAFRYSSKRFDSGSQTMDMGARRFTSKIGGFLQEDFLDGASADLELSADPISANRYSLAGGNPVSFMELDGHRVALDPRSSSGKRRKGQVAPATASRRIGTSMKSTALYRQSDLVGDQTPSTGKANSNKDSAGDGLKALWNETKEAVSDPVGTAKGAAHAVTHPKQTIEAIASSCDGASWDYCATYVGGQLIGGKGAGTAIRAGRAGAKADCSFTGQTLVLMADGTLRPIRLLRVGDKVMATDPLTGQQTPRTVLNVWSHMDRVVRLNVAGERLTTTEDHPFYNETDAAWQRADKLDRGDVVATGDGTVARVKRIRLGGNRVARAYNLTVEGVHTYHVGAAALLVHNDCDGDPGDDALVARGGADNSLSAEKLSEKITTHPDGPRGWSAESKDGACLEELCQNIPNNQVGVTTAGAIRSRGGDVKKTRGRSPNHVTITGIAPEALSELLRPAVPNPAKR